MIYQSSTSIKNYQIITFFCLHRNVFSPFSLNCESMMFKSKASISKINGLERLHESKMG
jgi:hypothetical protein